LPLPRAPPAHKQPTRLCPPTLRRPRDKETLRARLLLAIENAEGFGLM
jgi:hypothetical protein